MENTGVNIVTIKEKKPLYKKDELATKVELITFEENGFHVVSQKDLYEIGNKAVYIIPDYNLPDTPLFESFIRPNGDEGKSMLGKVNGKPSRIRAKKFSLSLDKNGIPVYSNGILLPINEVIDKLKIISPEALIKIQDSKPSYLDIALKIEKYEEPEVTKAGNVNIKTHNRAFPQGVYKTDETNINLLWNHIEEHLGYPIKLNATIKVDGSSISIGITDKYPDGFIASRNLRKDLTILVPTGVRKKTFLEKLLFWKKPDLTVYEEQDNPDDFITYGKPYIDFLKECGLTNVILRGELNGGHLKGSGNPNNPSKKLKPNIKFFYIDDFEDGVAEKMDVEQFNYMCTKYDIPAVEFAFRETFNSREEIEKKCNDFFRERKESTKELIEGLVLTTMDNTFSAKFMNDEYDSKK